MLEEGVLACHPETTRLGAGVFVGHRTMLKGDTRGELNVGDGAWIGQAAFCIPHARPDRPGGGLGRA